MPCRLIRDEMLESERVLALPIEARWLYVTILLTADDLGLFEATGFKLARRSDIRREASERLLGMLADADLVRLYEVNGKRFGFVPRFRQRVQIKFLRHPAPPHALMADDQDALSKIRHLASKTTVGKRLDNGCAPDGQPSEAKAKEEEIHLSPGKGVGGGAGGGLAGDVPAAPAPAAPLPSNPDPAETSPAAHRPRPPPAPPPAPAEEPDKPLGAPKRPDDVDAQTWGDFLALRRAKKAPVTETVLKRARSEADKARMPLAQFLAVWCARGSQGLEAAWLTPEERRGAGPAQPAETFRERDERLARERWQEMAGRRIKPVTAEVIDMPLSGQRELLG